MKDINTFVGTFSANAGVSGNDVPLVSIEPLTVENILWSNTVLAAGRAVGFVIYTGPETRAVMNTSHPGTKVGLLDLEINRLAKVSLQCFYHPTMLEYLALFRSYAQSRLLSLLPW